MNKNMDLRVLGFETSLTIGACLIYMVSSSVRANYGILLQGITSHTGLDYASASFVIAIGQLMFGFMQPVFGVVALNRSPLLVLLAGVGLMASGLFLTPLCAQIWLLALVFGCVISSGTAALAFGNAMMPVTPKLTPRHVLIVSGIVSGGYGFASLILSPVLQSMMHEGGIILVTRFLTGLTLLLVPIVLFLTRPGKDADARTATEARERQSTFSLFAEAVKSRVYRHITLAFFTCGFHMSIMETHLFSQMTSSGIPGKDAAFALSLVGLGTVTGAIGSGVLCTRFPLHRVLGTIYALRVPLIMGMFLLPKTLPMFIVFCLLFGLTGTATVAPTSGLVNRTFGARKVAALFGCCYLFHQVGSFSSAWLGGIFENAFGSSMPVWYVSIALSTMAAILACTATEKC